MSDETTSAPDRPAFRADLLAGKRILVTGGGTGLGAEMALRFARLGAAIAIVGRRAEVLEATARSIREATGARVDCEACDVRDPSSVERTIDTLWGDAAVDVLVNNAAATFTARTERLSPRAFDAVIAPTLNGTIWCTLAAGRRWIDSGRRGVVLSILSPTTITGRAFTVPSAIAKSGVLAMTRSLAVEWGPKGVRLVAIAPGHFPTPGVTRQMFSPGRGPSAPPGARNPLGRTGKPGELADLACFLVSDEAGYINGEMIAIDGGEHYRTSGAEDMLGWSDVHWDALRAR